MISRSNTLRDQAYQLIRNMIIKQELSFGSKLSVADLSRQFGISNSPIREAISLLEMDGLVINVPNYGFHVIDFNKKSFLEVSQTIQVIITGGYSEAIRLGKLEELKKLLSERLAFQEKCFTGEPSYDYACASIGFDRAFVDVLDNDMLIKMFDGKFNLLIMDTLYAYDATQSSVEDNLKEHKDILNAVIADDKSKVFDLIWEHYNKKDIDFSKLVKLD